MISKRKGSSRLIALDPMARGFGFAVIEGNRLIDWGLRYPRGEKNPASVRAARSLIEWYGPKLLVLEDMRHPGSRKQSRAKRLFRGLRRLAAEMNVGFAAIPWRTVRAICGGGDRANKERIAANVATLFPELTPELPPHRKIWMPEDPRMNVFDAAALGFTYSEHLSPKPKTWFS